MLLKPKAFKIHLYSICEILFLCKQIFNNLQKTIKLQYILPYLISNCNGKFLKKFLKIEYFFEKSTTQKTAEFLILYRLCVVCEIKQLIIGIYVIG